MTSTIKRISYEEWMQEHGGIERLLSRRKYFPEREEFIPIGQSVEFYSGGIILSGIIEDVIASDDRWFFLIVLPGGQYFQIGKNDVIGVEK